MSAAQCVAPRNSGRICDREPVPEAPFPLCVRHLAMAYEFALQRLRADSRAAEPPRPGAARYLGTVYYLRVGNLIKIGTTADLSTRLRAYPPDAELLATEPDTGGRTERRRHEQFQRYRAARREWFRPAPELIDHVRSLARIDNCTSTVAADVHTDGLSYLARRLAADE